MRLRAFNFRSAGVKMPPLLLSMFSITSILQFCRHVDRDSLYSFMALNICWSMDIHWRGRLGGSFVSRFDSTCPMASYCLQSRKAKIGKAFVEGEVD